MAFFISTAINANALNAQVSRVYDHHVNLGAITGLARVKIFDRFL